MWYAALLRFCPRTSTITIFIAAIEVMTEPSISVAPPIASAASLPAALSIIVTIVFVLFITMVTGVMTARCGLLTVALALATHSRCDLSHRNGLAAGARPLRVRAAHYGSRRAKQYHAG